MNVSYHIIKLAKNWVVPIWELSVAFDPIHCISECQIKYSPPKIFSRLNINYKIRQTLVPKVGKKKFSI